MDSLSGWKRSVDPDQLVKPADLDLHYLQKRVEFVLFVWIGALCPSL